MCCLPGQAPAPQIPHPLFIPLFFPGLQWDLVHGGCSSSEQTWTRAQSRSSGGLKSREEESPCSGSEEDNFLEEKLLFGCNLTMRSAVVGIRQLLQQVQKEAIDRRS